MKTKKKSFLIKIIKSEKKEIIHTYVTDVFLDSKNYIVKTEAGIRFKVNEFLDKKPKVNDILIFEVAKYSRFILKVKTA